MDVTTITTNSGWFAKLGLKDRRWGTGIEKSPLALTGSFTETYAHATTILGQSGAITAARDANIWALERQERIDQREGIQ